VKVAQASSYLPKDVVRRTMPLEVNEKSIERKGGGKRGLLRELQKKRHS
jgi:hypothetical protein